LINGIEEIYEIDEKPKFWPYGPVFPRVHKKFKAIKEIKRDKIESISDKEAINILEKTVEKWGNIPAGKLSIWSHTKGSPWDLLRIEGANWNTEIDLDYIKIYFTQRVENVIN
jgi:uncharacterized phage-associated protein